MIAFIGSVFSPYYAWSRRRGSTDPMRHCALNVALYGRTRRWAMTERRPHAVARDQSHFLIGPSLLSWDGNGLTVQVNEVGMPLPRRIQGIVRLYPSAVETRRVTLDAVGRHRWQPIAPCARVEVLLEQPSQSWSGSAYFDTNEGDRPLEADFVRWDWSRASLPDGAAILYDIERLDGGSRFAMRYRTNSGVEDFAADDPVSLPSTLWRVERRICARNAQVQMTLEDTPFYARSVVTAELLGQPVTAVHESLSLRRFANPLVQAMLAFRMPRA